MSSKRTTGLWHAGILALGLVAGCGRSDSHHEPGVEPSSATGGAGDESHDGGATAITGGPVAPSGGAGGPSAGGSGGTSPDGEPVGGADQDLGGSAGAGAAPSLAPPPGCQLRMSTETADVCSLTFDCDTSPSVGTYCHRLDSGQWECQCAFQERMYRVENAAGLQACALATRICSDPAPELGAENCEHTSDSSDQDGCAVELTCSSPVKLDEATDAQAWAMRFGSARCNKYVGAQSFACSCLDGTRTSNYELVAESGKVACAPLADFCMSGATPAFDGKETCLPVLFSSDSEGCQRSSNCGPQTALTDNVDLVRLQERYASCTPRSGGGSECSCSDRETAFFFDLSSAPNDANCESAIRNCDPNAVIKEAAPASCKPLSADTAGDDACHAFLTCVQNATVDDRSIVAHGNLILNCRRAEAGMPWWCSCASGQDTARIELGATSANATQACNQGATACLERMGLHLGPAGDPMEPPDPLQ